MIEWLPTANADVVKAALPPLSVIVPSTVVPSMNAMVPVGVPTEEPIALTAAVKVTGALKVDGFELLTNAVELAVLVLTPAVATALS